MSFGEFDIPTFEEGNRVSAGALNKLAALAARGHMSVDAYIDSLGVSTAQYPPEPIYHFELAVELTQWATTPTLVYRRFLDPSGNNGNGIYVTTCDATTQFDVMDLSEVGYKGPAGSTGTARIITVDNGLIGVIMDLRCPDDCICGTAASTTPCGGT